MDLFFKVVRESSEKKVVRSGKVFSSFIRIQHILHNHLFHLIVYQMPKRSSTTTTMARKTTTRVGIPYLSNELKAMEDSEYIVITDERDFRRWEVGFPPSVLSESLKQELAQWSAQTNQPPMVVVRIAFPDDFPHSAPFVRVIRPRFQFHTGHVTIAGSICTEMLTPQGWSKMSPKALFDAVAFLLEEGGGRIQLHHDWHHPLPFSDYPSEHEAREAYTRVATTHGWRL